MIAYIMQLWCACIFLFSQLFCVSYLYADSSKAYLSRFSTWFSWYHNPPKIPEQPFLKMIEEETPLAKRLRHRFLLQLAQQKNWEAFQIHYHPSQEEDEQCYSIISDYYLGKTKGILDKAVERWLTGKSLPTVCSTLFELIIKPSSKADYLITERLRLALAEDNLPLIHYLLKQLSRIKPLASRQFLSILEKPERIFLLKTDELSRLFYLYGLKKILKKDLAHAMLIWKNPKTKQMLSLNERDMLLALIALQKAKTNAPDTYEWFLKVPQNAYTDPLIEWQIRWALKQHRWDLVIKLIRQTPHFMQTLAWQYWLARSLEKTQHQEEANRLYEALSTERHYYGFLSSARLNKPYSLKSETLFKKSILIEQYKPILHQITTLYRTKQKIEASRLVNDFISELPKEEESQIALWLSEELQWYGKSVMLTNKPSLSNQLSLRFPLPFFKTIQKFSTLHHTSIALIYAIIRQESAFQEDVVSTAGALGLMQLMPNTAKFIAKKTKLDYRTSHDLLRKETNIALGIAYLEVLSKQFDHHPILIAAAYNAGPKQVSTWLKNNPEKDLDLWIETIPWQETRNYIKNILAFYVIYQHRIHASHHMSLRSEGHFNFFEK